MLGWRGEVVSWGARTSAYPANTDPKDAQIPVERMFDYVERTLILSYWSRVDEKNIRRSIENLVDDVNLWLNGLVGQEHLLGGRVEFRGADNPFADLVNGIKRFHLMIAPPGASEAIHFILEYDPDYVTAELQSLAA